MNLSGNKLIYDANGFMIAIAAFGVLFLSEIFQERGEDAVKYFLQMPLPVRWAGYYLLIIAVFYYSGAGDTFVYLKF